LRDAIRNFPKADAVLVRGHGVYVWGADWMQAKTQAECYDYLFSAAVRMKELGLDPTIDRRAVSRNETVGISNHGNGRSE
jgi:ribulose-5-phosphate 4-epimerase/fuculose-1-phosphate aldolase